MLHRRQRERDAAEAARRMNELRYRTLFEYAPDGIVIDTYGFPVDQPEDLLPR